MEWLLGIIMLIAGSGITWFVTHVYYKTSNNKFRDIEVLNLMASLGNKGEWTNELKSVVNRYLNKISEKLNDEQKTVIDQMIKTFAINVYEYVATIRDTVYITYIEFRKYIQLY